MNSRDIQKLRRKFILIAMVSVFLVLVFIGGAINTLSLVIQRRSIRTTLEYVTEHGNDSAGPPAEPGEAENTETTDSTETTETTETTDSTETTETGESFGLNQERSENPSISDVFSPSYQHNHFFIISFDNTGSITEVVSNTTTEEEIESAKTNATFLYNMKRTFGRIGVYYFLRTTDDDGNLTMTFLDCTNEVSASFRLLAATIITSSIALIITFVLVLLFSDRAVRPEIENSRRQKMFITNASHELKTPLAVIRANTELLELMHGPGEWTQSTLKQVDHLNGLIQNLVMINRAEEREDRSAMTEIDVSTAIEQSVDPYESLAKQSGKALIREIQPDTRIVADESKIRQLATLLIDNAIKYCDEGGTITIALSQAKKGIRLVVSNSFAEGEKVDYNRFFDRFYREDKSHNIDKGGYGIGLSIAESICRQYQGSIRASWKDGVISFTCLLM